VQPTANSETLPTNAYHLLQKPSYTLSTTMDNLQPVSNIDPSELPAGFTTGGSIDPKQQEQQMKQQQMEEQKQSILTQVMTPEALARLRRIKLVKPQKATQVENALVSMAMSNKLPGRITEAKLIEMLERNSQKESAASSGSISIQRKRYAMDSDDEDDNDDDLL